jgi:hypothetical protein
MAFFPLKGSRKLPFQCTGSSQRNKAAAGGKRCLPAPDKQEMKVRVAGQWKRDLHHEFGTKKIAELPMVNETQSGNPCDIWPSALRLALSGCLLPRRRLLMHGIWLQSNNYNSGELHPGAVCVKA